jgi:ADP-heptose:LPS heptosyltransferase
MKLGNKNLLRYIRNRLHVVITLTLGLLIQIITFIRSKYKNDRYKNDKFIKILVLQVFEMGDLIITSITLQNLKKNFPFSRITLLCGEWNLELARLLEYVDSVEVYNSPAAISWKSKYKSNFFSQIKKILRLVCNYDIIFDIRGDIWTSVGLLMAMIKKGKLLVYSRSIYVVYNLLSSIFGLKKKIHEVEKQLFLLKLAKLKIYDDMVDLRIREIIDSHLLSFLKFTPYIIFHVGAKWEYRLWPGDLSRDFIKGVLKYTKCSVVLTGTKEDLKFKSVKEILSDIEIKDNKRVINLIGKTNISELIWVIFNSNLYISADTGTLHLAVGLGVPAIGLFGPNDPQKIGPYKGKSKFIIFYNKLPCSPCKQIKCVRPDDFCMMKISSESVLRQVIMMLPSELISEMDKKIS